MITVYDFIELCQDPGMLEVVIYDLESDGAEIYRGYADEIPDDIMDLTVESFDVPDSTGVLGINVSIEAY